MALCRIVRSRKAFCIFKCPFQFREYYKTSVLFMKNERVLMDDEEFSVLNIPGHSNIPPPKREKRRLRAEIPPPRYKSMSPDQDWTDVWPTAHTFRWSVIPLPVRQGFINKMSENDGISPGKYANAELMKIPNFLHLTPNHVKKHCAVLKQFCNDWPKGLETDEACEKHFPIEITTRDYVADDASIRDVRARVVTLEIKLSALDLDYHARDKLIRLAGNHYDKKTDMLTLESDRCPLKRQNYEYTKYLLAALFQESRKTETWESEKALQDMEKYFWNINKSRTSLVNTIKSIKKRSNDFPDYDKNLLPRPIQHLPPEPSDDDIVTLPEVQEYRKAVEELHNVKETFETLDSYKLAVKKLLLKQN